MTEREQLLDELRPLAFRVAYRMLGSVSEAEDVVQEALLRVHQALERDEPIASPRAYLATVTTRLAIDELRSARARRELYVGEWLPEPIVTDDPQDPARQAEVADSISMAMLLVLESLTPEERAAFLSTTSSITRTATSRRSSANPRTTHASWRRAHAAMSATTSLGSHDTRAPGRTRGAVLRGRRQWRPRRARGRARPRRGADGRWRRQGAGTRALSPGPQPRGADVAQLVAGTRSGAGAVTFRPLEFNGEAGALLLDAQGRVMAALALEISGAEITGVRSVVNPDKLAHLGTVINLGEYLRPGSTS